MLKMRDPFQLFRQMNQVLKHHKQRKKEMLMAWKLISSNIYIV